MKLRLFIVALAILGASASLYGQAFPNRPIEIVLSSSPGGGVDLIFRLIAEELAKNLKTQVNVVNQPAGGGAIAAEKVASARKDGYTLLGSLLGQVATMTVANPKTPANLARDFQPIAILHGYAVVIMLGRADAEFKTLKDVVAHAQKKPGDLIVAVGPAGTSLTLEVELLRRAAKIDITSLPFAGSAQAITNLLGGHVNCRTLRRSRTSKPASSSASQSMSSPRCFPTCRHSPSKGTRRSICSPASLSWRPKACRNQLRRFWQTRSGKLSRSQSFRKI